MECIALAAPHPCHVRNDHVASRRQVALACPTTERIPGVAP